MGEAPSCYLSTPQAAALLGLSPRTLESYRVKGGGPPFLTCCNRIRYLRADLDRWAIDGRRVSTSDDGGGSGGKGTERSRRGGGRRPADTPHGKTATPHGPGSDTPALNGAARALAAIGTDPAHLSVRELAALLQISRRTLDRYRARGTGPAFQKVDGRIVYARADVETWLASSGRSSTLDYSDDAPGSAPEPEEDNGDADPGSGEGAG